MSKKMSAGFLKVALALAALVCCLFAGCANSGRPAANQESMQGNAGGDTHETITVETDEMLCFHEELFLALKTNDPSRLKRMVVGAKEISSLTGPYLGLTGEERWKQISLPLACTQMSLVEEMTVSGLVNILPNTENEVTHVARLLLKYRVMREYVEIVFRRLEHTYHNHENMIRYFMFGRQPPTEVYFDESGTVCRVLVNGEEVMEHDDTSESEGR